MFADLSLHFVRSNRLHAGKGNQQLVENRELTIQFIFICKTSKRDNEK